MSTTFSPLALLAYLLWADRSLWPASTHARLEAVRRLAVAQGLEASPEHRALRPDGRTLRLLLDRATAEMRAIPEGHLLGWEIETLSQDVDLAHGAERHAAALAPQLARRAAVRAATPPAPPSMALVLAFPLFAPLEITMRLDVLPAFRAYMAAVEADRVALALWVQKARRVRGALAAFHAHVAGCPVLRAARHGWLEAMREAHLARVAQKGAA